MCLDLFTNRSFSHCVKILLVHLFTNRSFSHCGRGTYRTLAGSPLYRQIMFTLWTWGMQRSCWQASLLTGYFHTVDMALVLKSCWQASLPTDYFHIVDVVRVQILQVGSPSYCQVTTTLQTLDVLDPFAAAWSLWHRAAKKTTCQPLRYRCHFLLGPGFSSGSVGVLTGC